MKSILLLTKRLLIVSSLCVFISCTAYAGNGNKPHYKKKSYKKKSKKLKVFKSKKKGEKFQLYRHREGTPISN